MAADALLLNCEGLDTIADICVNGCGIGSVDNMHRTWCFDVTRSVHPGENEIEIHFASPTCWIKEANRRCEVDGSTDAMVGFPHLRKAHCMFGWDWGPRLPDAGIWRNISLLCVKGARLLGVLIGQTHDDKGVTLHFDREVQLFDGGKDEDYGIQIKVTAPDGEVYLSDGEDIRITEPMLWWPNGYGAQPLYSVIVNLHKEGRVVNSKACRIGLRTVYKGKRCLGREFLFPLMEGHLHDGGDYFRDFAQPDPPTPSPAVDCALANHNCIRVWGGRILPHDWFVPAMNWAWWYGRTLCSPVPSELTPSFVARIRG